MDPVQSTVDAIKRRRSRARPSTFVVGFGQLSMAGTALNQMALAGGYPDNGNAACKLLSAEAQRIWIPRWAGHHAD